jgi:hypothetical protein
MNVARAQIDSTGDRLRPRPDDVEHEELLNPSCGHVVRRGELTQLLIRPGVLLEEVDASLSLDWLRPLRHLPSLTSRMVPCS